jgi:dTMP kinase
MEIKDRGLFIVFEGVDKIGKTTQIKSVLSRIGAENVLIKNFPKRDSLIGKTIDSILKGSETTSPDCLAMLFAAERRHRQSEIFQCLEKNHIICDRYSTSGIVYGEARGLDPEWLRSLEKGLIKPDLVFLFKLSFEYLKTRFENCKDKELLEFESLQIQAAEIFEREYKENTQSVNFIEVDASKPLEEISDFIINQIHSFNTISPPSPEVLCF